MAMESHGCDVNIYKRTFSEELQDNTFIYTAMAHYHIERPFCLGRHILINGRIVLFCRYKCHCFHSGVIERIP